MKKTIKIEFNELAKSVTTDVKIEYETEGQETQELKNKDILQETKELFEEAHTYAKLKTIQKQ